MTFGRVALSSPVRAFRSASVFTSLVAAGLLLASCGSTTQTYPHANEPIGSVLDIYNGTLTPDLAVATFRNIDRLFASRVVPSGGTPYPLPKADKQLTQVKFA